jgi:dipeptidyl-peptidase-4
MNLDDIYLTGKFSERSIEGVKWMKDGRYYSAQLGNDIVRYDVTTGKQVAVILDGDNFDANFRFSDYQFSTNEQKLLLTTAFERIYRRSFKANYYVYDLAKATLKPLSANGKQSYAIFSPDGSKVAFARDNNLFYVDLATGNEVQLTTDGAAGKIINGSADWVYEEEFSLSRAFEWSPDGQHLAYITFDESRVKEFNMQLWKDKSTLYPADYRFKYPKAGEENSVVNVKVFHLADASTTLIDTGNDTDIYLPRIRWTTRQGTLAILQLNRLQNQLELLHADVASGKTKTIISEKSDTYVDARLFDHTRYLNDGRSIVWCSEADGFTHLYLYDMEGNMQRQLTKGNWELIDFMGIDEQSREKWLYYTSSEVSPLEKHFYRIDLAGKTKQRLTPESGTHEINLSPDFTYYLGYHSNTNSPLRVALFQMAKNQLVKILEDNKELRANAESYQLPVREFFTFSTPDGTELNGYMLKPAQFDPAKKYPVLMFVYGGPGSQQVRNNWGSDINSMWHRMLTQEGYLIVCVDNRGTGRRGAAFKKITYGQLGRYETQDQIDAARHLGTLPYVDASRIGIWGWSYGGYMSSLCLMLGNDVFKMAIAVAPVSDWRYYDTVYTERYMKRPQDNPDGYTAYAPLSHAHKLKGHYLLVHGTGDDNVHFQNAVALQNALIAANKQFQSFYYPDRNHGIGGGNTRLHLYNMMTDFIKANL